MVSEALIRSRLQAVSDGELDVWEFSDWIDSYAWNMHRDSPRAAIHFASQVLHRFADYDIHGDEAALRRELNILLNNIVVSDALDVTPEQMQYFAYIKQVSLASSYSAADLVAA